MEFDWDRGNTGKNLKHAVSDQEAESAFSDPNKVQLSDPLHSQQENRYILLGKTRIGKILFISYTHRKNEIRVISARVLNKKEKHLYEKNA